MRGARECISIAWLMVEAWIANCGFHADCHKGNHLYLYPSGWYMVLREIYRGCRWSWWMSASLKDTCVLQGHRCPSWTSASGQIPCIPAKAYILLPFLLDCLSEGVMSC